MRSEAHERLAKSVNESLTAEVKFDIRVHRAGDPTTGLWCDSCLLPSAVRMAILTEIGEMGPMWVTQVEGCVQCGSTRLNPPS